MQTQKIAIYTKSDELYESVRRLLGAGLAHVTRVEPRPDADVPAGTTLALVDGGLPPRELRALFERVASHAVYAVLVDDEKHIGNEIPQLMLDGLVDDLLLLPIRPIELLGKLKHVAHLERVREVANVNADLKTLIERFEEDVRTARAIQRSLIPEKFNPVAGLKVTHKYLSGLKSGGDYLDFFEFEDKTHVGILMSDSTGYGLSSAFMSVILRLAVKLSKDEFRSPSATVAKIFEELKLTMKPKEDLSIFYAILNRKTFELTYAGGGTVRFVHQNEKNFEELTPDIGALTKDGLFSLRDRKVTLMPGDRVALFTDGFGEVFKDEGSKAIERACVKTLGDDAVALVNEMVFRVKKTLETEDDMPAQDCAVLVIDVEKRAMRLAK